MGTGRRSVRASLLAFVIVAGGATAIGSAGSAAAPNRAAQPKPRAATPVDATLTIGPASYGQPVPSSFLGFSIEYWALESYAGKDPSAVNPVLIKLIRNLTQGRSTVLRIGGVTTDQTWWPVHGVPRPPGAFYILNRKRLRVAKALAAATRARLILGVQFEADSTVEAAAAARAIVKYVGRRRLAGLELGNEPELFPHAPFYSRHGTPVYGRPGSYDFQAFLSDYAHIAAAMGHVPLAGPATGYPVWMGALDQFLSNVRGVSVVTIHRYPLQGCSVGPSAPNYPTIANLLADPIATGAADPFATFVNTAHAHHVKLREDEVNTVACGNGRGVANTFSSALWALAAMFEAASIGVDGVNIHTYPRIADQLFAINRHRASVAPEYYGLLMFGRAAPAGSHLLQVTTGGNLTQLRAWGTRSASGRTRVVLINDSLSSPRAVAVSVPGGAQHATLERLQAPAGASATRGITIGGQSYRDNSRTVALRGPVRAERLTASGGRFVVTLPPASAALLTLG